MNYTEFAKLALQLHGYANFVALRKCFFEWEKLFPNGTSDDAKAYLRTRKPKENAVPLRQFLQAYGEATPHAVSMSEKWLALQKLPVDQTFCGPYLSPETAGMLKAFLDTAIPVRPEFDSFCTQMDLDHTPAVFSGFLIFSGKKFPIFFRRTVAIPVER
jgi:hypothetical protein